VILLGRPKQVNSLSKKSRRGQMSPAADPPLSRATLGGAWMVARWGTAGVNPAFGCTQHYFQKVP